MPVQINAKSIYFLIKNLFIFMKISINFTCNSIYAYLINSFIITMTGRKNRDFQRRGAIIFFQKSKITTPWQQNKQ